MGYAGSCGEQQTPNDGLCCDKCPPGEYMKEFCNADTKTVCSPCPEGYYSDHFNLFDRCEKCQSCPHEYDEKCTPTTNAKCSCRSGFLCSSNECLTCEENKCVAGEIVNRTDIPQSGQLIKYTYSCEAACTAHAYFDVKEQTCKQRTQCSAFGLAELFPGNKTHDSVCDICENYPVLGLSTADFPLPKEECGLQLSISDECKECSHLDELHQGKVPILCT
ncbi:tumor necrosis factor receptor superfamily member 18 isoform X2 [Platichthys flesus]|uniref:tumor necrosis factor receptor superfamily member 18 isoform X2 n=1 Tax=Platichthys flesus TaxID=8260 RepID=UPI002DB820D8|nr:tumor necrosis factor receptor superfamily member 18 isoform X2 [Platichthys flesus]